MNKFRMFPPLLGLVFLLAGCGDSRPAETVRLVTYNAGTFNTVSYTHLTLPTTSIV